MPRRAKDKEISELEEIKASKKVVSKKAKTAASKSTSKKPSKVATDKKAASKKSTAKKEAPKKTATKKPATKKTTTRKTTTKKTATRKTTTKKTTTKKTTSKKSVAKVATPVEYYDLPPVYNKTVVKILAQTPSCLFVYWEVSEKDAQKLKKQYGEEIFQNTKPYLVIINETMNYSFEIEINDYANSWYIYIHDSNCKYEVKLIRKPIHQESLVTTSVIDITSSNEMNTPNDHILFDKLGKTVFFRNVKTNIVNEKDISSISLINNIGRIYNIYDLYKEIYRNELNGDELGMNLSSSQFSSFFK